jgi:hypothetical protein
MPFTNAVLDAANDGAAAVTAWAAEHSDATSGTEVSAARVAVGWDPSSGAIMASGDVPLAFTGTPGGPATHLGLWSAQTDGTFRGGFALTGDQTFNAAGEYNITSIVQTASND